MKIIKIALILAILLTFSENIKAQHKVKNEFYRTGRLTEALYKGVYLRKITKNDKEFFKFQFDGVLIGKNRFFEILFETNTDKESEKTVFISETDKPAKAEIPAYLLFTTAGESSNDLAYKLKNKQYGDKYDFSKLPQSPDVFFEMANGEGEPHGNNVFVISILTQNYQNFFTVELMLWTKNKDGKYQAERYKTTIDLNSDFIDINITYKPISDFTDEDFVERGLTYLKKKRFNDALADFNKAIEMNPKNRTAIVQKAHTLEKLSRHEEAISQYKICQKKYPKDKTFFQAFIDLIKATEK